MDFLQFLQILRVHNPGAATERTKEIQIIIYSNINTVKYVFIHCIIIVIQYHIILLGY